MAFIANEETVIASLSWDKAHDLENWFYQMRDELMKVRISLIDGTANEFDFFWYHIPLPKKARDMIRKKFRIAMWWFMKRLWERNSDTKLKVLGILQVMIKNRR